MLLATQECNCEKKSKLGLLHCPCTNDLLVADAEHFFNYERQRLYQSILLGSSQLSHQFQNIQHRFLSLCDVGGVRLVLQSEVLEDSQTLECNFDYILQMLANQLTRVDIRFHLIGEDLQNSL